MKNYLNKLKAVLGTIITLWAINACTEIEPAIIDFNSVDASGLESDGAQSFQINFSKSISSGITLEFEFTGSAVKNKDYTFDNATVIVPAGESSATVNFRLLDNENYDPGTVKTITISLIGISGPGLDDVSFGDITTYTFTIKEDDMQIDLNWEDLNYTMRLQLMQGEEVIKTGPVNSFGFTSILLLGSDNDGTYETLSYMSQGSLTQGTSIPYSITLHFPDGSTETHGDNLIVDRFFNFRHLWEVAKSGGTYTAVKDPLGTDG